MYVPIVEDDKGHKYSISPRDRIGEGATAEVWLGVPLGSTASTASGKVAIKIPHPGASRADLEKLKEEYQITLAISGALRGRQVPEAMLNVPWMREGKSGTRVPWLLVMELAQTELQEAAKLNWSAAKTVEAVRQYLQLLVALHSAGFATYGDRKETDLRWDEARNRLIVLDWNRAGKLPENTEARNALVAQDAHGFAQLFSAILFGESNRSALPEVDNLTNGRWREIPRGVRVALIHARDIGSTESGNSVEALLQAITQYSEFCADTAKITTEDLIAKARPKPAPTVLTAPEKRRSAESQLNLLDIAMRRSDASQDHQRRIGELREAAERQLKSPEVAAGSELQRALDYIDAADDYQRAQDILANAINTLSSEHGPETLRLLRWRMFARLGVAVKSSGQELGQPLKDLKQVLKTLDVPTASDGEGVLKACLGDLETIASAWNILPRQYHSPTSSVMQCIEHEIQARLAAVTHPICVADGESSISSLEKLDIRYARCVVACLPSLSSAIGRDQIVDDEQVKLEKLRIDSTELWRIICVAKGDLNQIQSERFEGILSLCAILRHSAGEVESIENACLWLREIWRERDLPERRKSLAAMLRWAKYPPNDLPASAVMMAQSVLDRLQNRLRDDIAKRLESPMWPDEFSDWLDDAQALTKDVSSIEGAGAVLQLASGVTEADTELARQISERGKFLGDITAKLIADSRKPLGGHIQGGIAVPIGSDALLDSIVALLESAEEGKVEVFNVDKDNRGNWSVHEVLQRRRLSTFAKWERALSVEYGSADTAVNRIDIAGLQKRNSDIKAQIGNINREIVEFRAHVASLAELENEIANSVARIKGAASGLDPMSPDQLKQKESFALIFGCRMHLMEGFYAVQLPDLVAATFARDRVTELNPVGTPAGLMDEIQALQKQVVWLEKGGPELVKLLKDWKLRVGDSKQVELAIAARDKVYKELQSKNLEAVGLALIAAEQDHRALLADKTREEETSASGRRTSNEQRLTTALRSFLPTSEPGPGQSGFEEQLSDFLERGPIEMYLHLSRWHSELRWAVTALERAGMHLDRQERREPGALETDFGDAFRILSDLADRMDPSTFHCCHEEWFKVVERLRSAYEKGSTDIGSITALIKRGKLKSELGKTTTEKLIAAVSAIR